MSGLAVASIIIALIHFGIAVLSLILCFMNGGAAFYSPIGSLLDVNLIFCLIAWILALVFGHIALLQINRDPALRGASAVVACDHLHSMVATGAITGFLTAGKSS